MIELLPVQQKPVNKIAEYAPGVLEQNLFGINALIGLYNVTLPLRDYNSHVIELRPSKQ